LPEKGADDGGGVVLVWGEDAMGDQEIEGVPIRRDHV